MKNHRPDFILRMLCCLVLLFTAMACTSQSNSKKTSSSMSSRLDSGGLIGDTVVYTGAVHNANCYAEDENLIISMVLLSDTTILCKITKKNTEIKGLTKPLSIATNYSTIFYENPLGEVHKDYMPHGLREGEIQVNETIEGIYNVYNTFSVFGLILYTQNNTFFYQNGNYKIWWKVRYTMDYKKGFSLETPPLIFHNTISEDSLKFLDRLR